MTDGNQFIENFACPVCRMNLSCGESKLICSNSTCREEFKVVEGVPILIPEAVSNKNRKQIDHQIEWFDNHYEGFKEYKLENWRKSMLERIFSSLNIKESPERINETYLDIGVGGSGYTVIEAAKKGFKCLGVDLSLQGVLSAKRFAKAQGVAGRILFAVCSAEYLPFKDQAINKVSALSVIEHLYNDRGAIAEISRVAAANAKVFITVPNTYWRIWFFLWPFYYYVDKNIGHLRHYSEEKLKDMFKKDKLICRGIFYNGHLIKFWQLFLEKTGRIDDKKWWALENKDLSLRGNKRGVQLNALFEKMSA